ncbi:MAG TPA: hypothetical protein VFF41_06070 [Gallionella sp.]|nr:hypothetical protein [Gallionella sp.]
MSTNVSILEYFYALGTKSGMPRYVSALWLLQSSVLLVPEFIWAKLGVNALEFISNAPDFIQHYVKSTDFKNAMFMFWALSPITFVVQTFLCVRHINNDQGYFAFLKRRAIRLNKLGKDQDYSLVIGGTILLFLYVGDTGIWHLADPKILGNFVPIKNRLAMLIIHAGAIGFVFPAVVALLIAESRAILSKRNISGGN